jgi:hypothetical protein
MQVYEIASLHVSHLQEEPRDASGRRGAIMRLAHACPESVGNCILPYWPGNSHIDHKAVHR